MSLKFSAIVDNAVVGSGPGGSLTAHLLAEAGREVVLLEEGENWPLSSCLPFSLSEMEQKYRNGGLTVALGRCKVAYVEGRCVGGGSEINSGLYHRIPAEILAEWRTDFRVEALTESELLPHYESNERDLHVSTMPGPLPPASLKLHDGATRMGWKSLEVPRWFRYQPTTADPNNGQKQSMSATFVPRAETAGCRLIPRTRAVRLRRRGDVWHVETLQRGPDGVSRRWTLQAKNVFLACGAIHTPTLLQKSGLGTNVGRNLRLHPTIKVLAQFPEDINPPGMGVPVHQVKEFSPRLSFGCSISSPPHLHLAMLDHPKFRDQVDLHHSQQAIYYAMIRSGKGSVRTVPFYRDPLVRFHLDDADLADLADGLKKLCQCLFAAGATVCYPSLVGQAPFRSEADLANVPAVLPLRTTNLMTIHLFSSCPMGENRERCVADSFGRVHGVDNLWIADASLLPGAPGVNPQGPLMAIVRRNITQLAATR